MAVVNIERLADSTGTLAPQYRALEFDENFQFEDHPNDSLSGSPGAPGQVTGYTKVKFVGSATTTLTASSLVLGSGYSATSYTPIFTTDATVTNLGPAIAIPPGGIVTILAKVEVNVVGDGTNGGASGGYLFLRALVLRAGSAAPGVFPGSGDNGSLAVVPFGIASPLDTPANGKLALVPSGNNMQLQVVGENYSSIAAWTATTAYAKGNAVTGAGGAVYIAQGSNTSGSTQPSGTGNAVSDGGVTWCYVGPSGSVRFSWALNLLEILNG